MNDTTIAPLPDFGSGDVAVAGGKGAALGELARQGFPVPPGFIITTHAYAALLKDTGLDARLDTLLRAATAGVPADGARIRALFGGMEIPKDLAREIGDAYAALPLRWDGVVAMADEAIGAMRGITDLRVAYLPGIVLPVLKLRLWLLLLGKTKLESALVAGAETRTSQANRALEHLADIAAEDPVLARAFSGSDTARIADAVTKGADHEDFRKAFEAFLLEYGNRETVGVVLSSTPTWSEAPEVVLGIVKTMMGDRRQSADQTGTALDELRRYPALRFEPLRRRVLAVVESARAGMAFREDTHFYATKVLPPMRRAYGELGRRLARAGVTDEPHDVYHLRFDELGSIHDTADGSLPRDVRERYRPLVLARAEKRRELEGTPLLDTDLLFARRRPVPGALVSGAPASRGRAEGTVRVVRGPADFGHLRSGEILVCPYTNPSWTPLFQRAAAVVVDAGGIGSHAAIVAREYGIPAVMGTGTGTRVLADGQRVIVDGNAGVVTQPAGTKPDVPCAPERTAANGQDRSEQQRQDQRPVRAKEAARPGWT